MADGTNRFFAMLCCRFESTGGTMWDGSPPHEDAIYNLKALLVGYDFISRESFEERVA